MHNFTSYLVESKNTHLEHLEDNILNAGVDGARQSIDYLRNLRDMLAGKSKGKINVTVKWDGCVHENTVINTNMGNMSIKEIHNLESATDIFVKGYDFETQNVVMTRLFGSSCDEGNKDWVEVITEDGKLMLTEDHEVHTSNRGWVKAKELNEFDDIR